MKWNYRVPQKIVCLHAAILVTRTDDRYVQFSLRKVILLLRRVSQHICVNYKITNKWQILEIFHFLFPIMESHHRRLAGALIHCVLSMRMTSWKCVLQQRHLLECCFLTPITQLCGRPLNFSGLPRCMVNGIASVVELLIVKATGGRPRSLPASLFFVRWKVIYSIYSNNTR